VIHILFVPGTFGSTIHYILMQYNTKNKHLKIEGSNNFSKFILPDGSMHTFFKTGHYISKRELDNFFINQSTLNIQITAPVYPMEDATPEEIIELFEKNCPHDKYIFVYIDSLEYGEINLLARYHKIAKGDCWGSVDSPSIDYVLGIDNIYKKADITNWNASYTHWTQMQPWELREWVSIFYVESIQEWIDAKQYVKYDWLTVSNRDILDRTEETFLKIINYSGEFESTASEEFTNFVSYWREKQQYLIDEYKIINDIVEFTISNIPYTWKTLNLIAEAIIQRKLRSHGYNIKCFDLNVFPTNSQDLFNLLERDDKL
jgi:hypothetical protein